MPKSLDSRLNAHFATVRTSSLADALRRTAGNWQLYAAVTGSALAMTTNASAGVIYSNVNVKAGPIASAVSAGQTFKTYKQILVKNTANLAIGQFSFGPYQKFVSGGFLNGYANLKPGSKAAILITATNHKVRKFASGNVISGGAAGIWEGGTDHVGQETKGPGTNSHQGWAPSQSGFAGLRISTASHALDYGWIRLKFNLGENGAANGVTLKDFAINTTGGASILAGQGIPASVTPEPATASLALLAAGAAGVLALRRRRAAPER
jgi:hypothetical protein